MKCARIIAILSLAMLGSNAALAELIGTAFTYQGRLLDANDVADGLYDFQFKLYDANSGGNKIDGDVNVPDVDVIDGYFMIEVDFGDVFDGNAVWFEIGVRPGVQNDPCVYEVLDPRQKISAVPYALYALEAENGAILDSANTFTTGIQTVQTGGSSTTGLVVQGAPGQGANLQEWQDSSGNVLALVGSAGGIAAPAFYGNGAGLSSLDVSDVSSGTLAVFNGGTGASTPFGATSNLKAASLDHGNTFTIGIQEIRTGDYSRIGLLVKGALGQTANLQEWRSNLDVVLAYVSASGVFNGDGSGLTNLPNDGDWAVFGDNMYSVVTGNVGIGTTTPTEALDVAGTVKASAFIGNGSGLTNLANDGDWTFWDSNMYAVAAGKVGIGTTTPTEVLDVNGTVKATAFAGDGSGLTNLPSDGDWAVYDSNMYSIAAGSVGIGVSSPAPEVKLDVVNTSSIVEPVAVAGMATGPDGTGVIAEATDPTGETTGIEAVVYSPDGVAGLFANEGGGMLLLGEVGTEPVATTVFSLDGDGDLWLSGNLSAFGSVDVNNALNAQGDGYIGGDLSVAGSLLANAFDGLEVQGNGSISGTLNCYNDVAVSGNLHVSGSLSKGSGSFKIDHPSDPENKYLSHSFVESPDMMNVYNGNVVLDKKGCALVKLPKYFGALNTGFRYQLTCIGGFAPVYISEEISDNHFKIAGGESGMKVSWQVTGIRQDPYAKTNRIVVEEDKSAGDRGYYLHPMAFGMPDKKGIAHHQSGQKGRVTQVARKADEL